MLVVIYNCFCADKTWICLKTKHGTKCVSYGQLRRRPGLFISTAKEMHTERATTSWDEGWIL